jgi:predicted nucleic-acid-binding protein
MIAVDTNILVRYLVGDDPPQAKIAAKIIETAADRRDPLFVTLPVICEVVWVLGANYKQSRSSIAGGLQALVDSAAFEFEQAKCVAESVGSYRGGRADFADYLIGALAHQHGCDLVLTFDQSLRGAAGFKVL